MVTTFQVIMDAEKLNQTLSSLQADHSVATPATLPPHNQCSLPSSPESSLEKNTDDGEELSMLPPSCNTIEVDDHVHKSGNDEGEKKALSRVTTEEEQYITGVKLALVTMSVCMVGFLMLLDISIVATVITPRTNLGTSEMTMTSRPFPGSPVIFTRSRMLVGMVVHTNWLGDLPLTQDF